MKRKTEEEQKAAVIKKLEGIHKKALATIDMTYDLENRRARMNGEKPPHPGKAKRKAIGYVYLQHPDMKRCNEPGSES